MGPIRIRSPRSRIAILCVSAIAALVLPGYSFGAVTPRLVVQSPSAGPNQTLRISASKQPTDDAIGQLSLFVPTGYALNSPPPGTGVGTATAKVRVQDVSPNTEQSWLGTVVAISPTDPSVAYESVNCDPNQHLAAWMVRLNGSKGTFSFPIFIDATSDATASFGPYVLVICFRPADIPRRTGPSGERDRGRLAHARADTVRRSDNGRRVSLALALDTVHAGYRRAR